MKVRFLLFSIIAILSIACERNNENNSGGNPDDPLNFESLVAEEDTLIAGESTIIRATATGYQLNYNWSATAGDLLGSGSEVIYAVSPCHAGNNQIRCTVTDGNDESQTKSIIIVVY